MVVLISVVLVVKALELKIYDNPRKVIDNDVINFYSYLPATFVEKDITLSFIKKDVPHYVSGNYYWPEILLPDSTFVIKTTMGLSILYCPFFVVAHVLAEPLGYPADGFSPPYAAALVYACIFWVVLGCVFLRKVLLRRFSETTTTIVLGVTVVATNLLWYASYEAAYSHGFLFGLISLFLYQTERWYQKPSWGSSIALGLKMGLIALVRPTDALVAVYFLLYGITSWRGLSEQLHDYLHRLPMMVAIAVSVLIVWVPQMVYWHSLTGHLFFYSYTHDEHFFWLQPKLTKFLFGFRKGWIVYTPVMAFALLGLIPLYKWHRRYFYPTLLFLVLNVYILSCWWCWWYGGSFGQRSMVDCYGLLTVPMAAFVEWMLSRKMIQRIILIVLFTAVGYLSYFHYRQYKHQAIHYEAMTFKAYRDSFGHKHHSERFWELLEWPDYEAAKKGIR